MFSGSHQAHPYAAPPGGTIRVGPRSPHLAYVGHRFDLTKLLAAPDTPALSSPFRRSSRFQSAIRPARVEPAQLWSSASVPPNVLRLNGASPSWRRHRRERALARHGLARPARAGARPILGHRANRHRRRVPSRAHRLLELRHRPSRPTGRLPGSTAIASEARDAAIAISMPIGS